MKRREFGAAIGLLALGTVGLSACTASGSPGASATTSGSNAATQAPDSSADLSKLLDYNPQDASTLEDGGTFQISVSGVGNNFNGFSNAGNEADQSTMLAPMNNAGLWNVGPAGEYELDTNFCSDAKETVTDGKQVITYTLNPKAVWNDGTPIDYKTFVNQFEVLSGMTKEYDLVSKAGYEDIEKVERGKDDFEVIVTMKNIYEPYQDLYGALLHPAVNTPEIFNNGFVDNLRPEWRTGAFTLDNYDKTAQIATMKRNDKWWGDAPKLETVVVKAIDATADVSAFNNGQIDYVETRTKARIDQARLNESKDEFRRGQRLVIFGRVYNGEADVVKDVAVRKAIFQASDRSALAAVQFNGLDYSEALPKSWFQMNFLPHVEDNYPVTFDVAAAKKTLEDAGYALGSDGVYAKDGTAVKVTLAIYNEDPITTAINQTWQAQLKAAGIALTLETRDTTKFSADLNSGNFQIVNMGFSQAADPGSAPKQYFLKDGDGNYTNMGDAELDARIQKVNQIVDAAERAKEANAIEKEWEAKYFGYQPMACGPMIAAVRKGIANYGPMLYRNIRWQEVGWMKGTKQD